MRIVSYLMTLALGWAVYLVWPTDVAMAWIATAIGAGLGALSSLYGGHKASEASQKAQAYLDRQEARDRAWYERTYNQKYADTEAGTNLARRMKDFYKSAVKRADGAARVAGSTDAATARAKEQANKTVGDTFATIAANDTARRDRVDQINNANQKAITQQRIGIENQRAQNITNAASAASDAMFTAGALLDSNGGLKAPKAGGTSEVRTVKDVVKTNADPIKVGVDDVVTPRNEFWDDIDLA